MKEEIEEFLRKSEEEKEEDPLEAKIAIKITLLGYILMIPGVILWTNIYFVGGVFSLSEITIIALSGSILVGITIFLISIGSYLYLNSPRRVIKLHWVFKGVFRTFHQLYSWYSFVAIFFAARRVSPEPSNELLLIFLIFSLPAILGYPLAHWSKLRTICEDLVSSLVDSSSS